MPGARREVTMATSLGTRRVDVTTPGRRGIEVKSGRTSLTGDVRTQIAKDRELIRTGRLQSVEWRFARSPRTGKQGPTRPLEDELTRAGIPFSHIP
jgi:hypothetical protein